MHLGGQTGSQLRDANTHEITALQPHAEPPQHREVVPHSTISNEILIFIVGMTQQNCTATELWDFPTAHLQARTKNNVYFITTNATLLQQWLPSAARENSNLLIPTARVLTGS